MIGNLVRYCPGYVLLGVGVFCLIYLIIEWNR